MIESRWPWRSVVTMEWLSGMSQTALAERYRLSPQRIHQVVWGTMARVGATAADPPEVARAKIARHPAGHYYEADKSTPEGFYAELAWEERQ